MPVIKVYLPKEVLKKLATLRVKAADVIAEYLNQNKDCNDGPDVTCCYKSDDLQYHDGLGWVCLYCDRPPADR